MTTFTIPLMFLACLHWDVATGGNETIAGFDFQQPVEIDVDNATAVELRDNIHAVPAFGCAAVQAHHLSYVDFTSSTVTMTFGGQSGGRR